MGVTNLWTILAPVKNHKPLTDLKGQVLAVDLSIWVCENQSVKQMHGVVVKPHLRNLFFRVSHLTQLGVKLVFVIEGEAPELKWEEMWQRQQARGIVKPGTTFKNIKRKRSQFSSCLKECCELLDLMGVPHITGHGEAEAMCAALNAAGLVDGCLTDDGDAFLYGAQTVYRNFTMNSKDPHVESYCLSDIQTELGINRQSLVGLSLLLGCDYVPGGVAGVGVANAVKLLKSLTGMDVIQRFKKWKEMNKSECLDKIEMTIREKALKILDFPQQQVVDEFLIPKERIPKKPFMWKKANISASQEFGTRKLDWPVEYTLEKILPLVTLWSMLDKKQHGPSSKQLTPYRIVKSRVRHFIPCFEVEWNKDVWDKTSSCEYYSTVEEQGLFTECYPQLVSEYNTNLELTKKNKKRVSKKKVQKVSEIDDLASSLECTSLCTGLSNKGPEKLVPLASHLECKESDTLLGTKSTDENFANLISVKPKACKPKSNKLQNQKTSNMTGERKESSSVVIVPDDAMDLVDDDVFVPLSVRIKQKLAKEKIKGNNNQNVLTDSGILSTMLKTINPGEESETCKVVHCVKRKLVCPSTPKNESKDLTDTALQKNIHFQVDNIPLSASIEQNRNDKKSSSETSLDTISYSVKPLKVVSSSVSDMSSAMISQKKNEQLVENEDKLKQAEVSGRTSKTKKLKLKKRSKSVKKNVLLLDDSVSETDLDAQTIEASSNVAVSQSEIVYLDHASKNIYTVLKQKDNDMNKENEKVPSKSDIDNIIDNALTQSLQNLTVVKENSPRKSLQHVKTSQSMNNSAKKLLYSAIKKGCRKISTPCHNFQSPHQLKTPYSVVFNRTADLDFGNFKIQTSLLDSLLVSNVESPENAIQTTNNTTDIIGSADKVALNIDQSTPMFEIDSCSCDSKIVSVSYSPMIPLIQNDIKMLLDFEQSPHDVLKASDSKVPVIPLVPNISISETTYCSPAPLSLKDRLKLRLKDSNSQVLKDLSNM